MYLSCFRNESFISLNKAQNSSKTGFHIAYSNGGLITTREDENEWGNAEHWLHSTVISSGERHARRATKKNMSVLGEQTKQAVKSIMFYLVWSPLNTCYI